MHLFLEPLTLLFYLAILGVVGLVVWGGKLYGAVRTCLPRPPGGCRFEGVGAYSVGVRGPGV